MLFRWPIVSLASVVHVGSPAPLFPRAKPPEDSLEGPLLSVSRHPAEWTYIARLGGGRWTQLRDPSRKLRLVDARRISPELRGSLLAAGVEEGLCSPATFWKSFSTDEDANERFSLHPTKEEAEVETEDGCSAPVPTDVWIASPALTLFWSGSSQPLDPGLTESSLVTFFAQREARSDLDGVWWSDDLDPFGLSAPRGGIFQSRLPLLRQIAVPAQEWC